jgi:hypothetical protein
MARGSGAVGFFRFLGASVAIMGLWLLVSLQPIKQLHDAYSALTREREQVAVLEQQVHLLERQLNSTKAFGSDLEIQLRQAGMARPYEKVIFLKPDVQVVDSVTTGVPALQAPATTGSAVARRESDGSAPAGGQERHATSRVKKSARHTY